MTNVIDIIRTAIAETLNALRRQPVPDITAGAVIVPSDFAVAPRASQLTVER